MAAGEVTVLLDGMIRGLVAGIVVPATDAPADVKPWLDDLLSKVDTYRDAALIVLAFAVDAGSPPRLPSLLMADAALASGLSLCLTN